jgi:hypothetical protein
MLLHTVLFWLRPDLTAAEVATFEAGLASLTSIPTVRWSFIGKPAATRRPVIDSSYSYQLVVGFDDLAGHDIYQEIAVHEDFRQAYSPYWTKVLIYDAQ